MIRNTVLLVLLVSFIMCMQDRKSNIRAIVSPDGNIQVEFFLSPDGEPAYNIKYKQEIIIDTSFLGLNFRDAPPFSDEFKMIKTESRSFNETWEMPWGEQQYVSDNYHELAVFLKETKSPCRLLVIRFRVFNDGVGFRYELPQQKDMKEVIITDENTQFKLTGDHTCWWIPGDWDIYEHLYNETKFSKIDAISKRNHSDLAQTYIPENAVNTPVTMRSSNGIHLSFHEANLTNYPDMTLKTDTANLLMQSELVGSERTGYKARVSLPFHTPWRTIQIVEKATDLLASKLILNLNEPNKLGDISWFKPMKYIGIWWEMHLGKSEWNISGGKHGATTENARRYIDFAAANNIDAVLIEGWNTGWEHWIGFDDREGVFDFVTPYPDYDLNEVASYAKEKGVEIIMHHETSAAPRTYEQQLDTAFSLMQDLDMHALKTGYVGKIIPEGEYHHGQWMVNHYRKVLEYAAKYKIAVNAHEPIKATGIRRTYPNAVSREGLRGQEFNAWAGDGGNPPSHIPTVVFTRMLAGPIDYTPGVFNIKLEPYKKINQVNTTLAHQLALYVVIYSPLQMACDMIENYEDNPAFQFIRDVGVDWIETLVLNGEVGDFVTIARKEKGSSNWYVGSVTDENPRLITINFNFLDAGSSYEAIIYKDGNGAHWDTNPLSLDVAHTEINNNTSLTFYLAPGGGVAISLMK